MLLVIKPIRQYKRRNQTPSIDSIAYPCADDLCPTSPVRTSYRHEVGHGLLVEVAGKQRSDPACAQEEDDVEETVIILCGVALVVAGCLGGRIVLVFGVRVVERGGREGTRLHSGAEGSLAHVTARFRLLGDEAVLVVIGADLRIAVAVGVALRAESQAVGSGAGRGVGDGNEGDDGADDDGGLAGAACADQRVALVVIGLHADGGEGQVGAVDGDDGGLGETSAGVDILNGGVDRDDGCDEEEQEIDLYMSVTGLDVSVKVRTVMAAWFIPHPLLAK